MFSRSPPARRLIQRLFRPSSFSPKQASPKEQLRFFDASSPRRTTNGVRLPPKPKSSILSPFLFVTGAGILTIAVTLHQTSPAQAEAPVLHYDPDDRDPSLPRFRMSEIRKHDGKSANPWVIKDDKVYDITEWVSAHPGGDVILRAAGSSIDPYWDIFAIHKTQYVYDILSQYLIGFVDTADLVDGKPALDEIEDPFSAEPERNPALIVRTNKPMNAETPDDAVVAEFFTPNDLFYVRNHMWVPKIEDPDNYPLTIELTDGTIKKYTLRDLKTKFKPFKVTAALQCSGNRRKHMSDGSGRKANGLPWNAGAISNACWEGVLLSDVLADAGFDLTSGLLGTSEAKHVQFSALEAYGASIPIKKAVDPHGDVILAYSMNGQPLPRDHGFPLRAIVPGHVAARSVKWLSQITLSDEESHTQWQRKDYKCFGPNQTTVDWDKAPSIQELPVQSAITGCKLGEWKNHQSADKSGKDESDKKPESPAQEVSLTGYAYSGGGRSIIRVDVSLDGGKSWTQAELLPDCVSKDGTPSPCLGHGSWAWRRWKYNGIVPLDAFEPAQQSGAQENETDKEAALKKRAATFICKATDESYNTQPESHAATWNIRGNLATAWHRLKVVTECPNLEAIKGQGEQ